MSTDQTGAPADTTGQESTSTGSTENPDEITTFNREYVEKLRAEAAKYRTEAKANGDAAKKLAAIEDAQKSETQRFADLATAAETKAAQAMAEAMRWKIAAKHGISDDDADTFLTGADEETLTRQAERLTELAKSSAAAAGPGPRPDLSQGARGATASADPADQFATFITKQLNK